MELLGLEEFDHLLDLPPIIPMVSGGKNKHRPTISIERLTDEQFTKCFRMNKGKTCYVVSQLSKFLTYVRDVLLHYYM